MDVQCERCKVVYELDDVLVTEQGTPVRCTHCGNEFKVRRGWAASAPDAAGGAAGDAGGDRWVVVTAGGQRLTFLSLIDLQRAITAQHVTRADTLIETSGVARPLGSIKELDPFFDGRLSSRPPPPAGSSPPRASVPASPPAAEERDTRSSFPFSTDEPYGLPRHRVGGWIVALVLVGAVGVVGWVTAKPYLVSRGGGAPPDSRAAAFIDQGDRALSAGDLDGAQQDFDKASALVERDPRTLLGEARVAAAKADVPWLELRLLPEDAAEQRRTTQAEFDEQLKRARRAADDAMAAAPGDPAAVRVEVDVLRMAGDKTGARADASKLNGVAPQPDTAYVLAALDLSEAQPIWPTVIERLRFAAAAEGGGGRARAALVYALVEAGDLAGARSELAALSSQERPYPLLANLHAFVDAAARAKTMAQREPPGAAAPMAPLPSGQETASHGRSVAKGAIGRAEVEAPASEGPTGGMSSAAQALRKGDFARARRIYEGLVARNSSDSEALAGLADVDRASGDTAAAIAAYKRAIAVNPSYLPALLGLADTEWASGDRASAQRAYKDITDHFPDGTYPAYVQARAEPAPAAASNPPSAPASPPPSSSGAHVDETGGTP